MDPRLHARAKEVFLAACARPADELTAYLDEACGGEEELRREVERLLSHNKEETLQPLWAAETLPQELADATTTPPADGSGAPIKVKVGPVDAPRRFEPGTMITDRYRIISRIGAGGMGEVFGAEDLKLQQKVALKFLPPALVSDPDWLARLHREVRVAREVAHPNICRVFDITEADGEQFMSMEYVAGEDLATLLKRIGRLPRDKAIDIARQVCAGLAAAHARRVLHRDLKPANIMLDNEGRVRITDFGLAAGFADTDAEAVRAGTPAYMAPEQITGKEVSIKTDIYALGLVLYELFTGRRAFQANSIAEFVQLHEHSRPPSMTSIVDNIDPQVERIVLRCLDKDPANRPASAMAVAAALPGGDALALALAAGETPSPEMVAAAEATRLHGRVAANWLLGGLIGLLVGLFVLHAWTGPGVVSPEMKAPAVLVDRVQRLLADIGIASDGLHCAYGFIDSDAATRDLQLPVDNRRLRTAAGDELVFWYRHGPTLLLPTRAAAVLGNLVRGALTDPPPNELGMTTVILDLRGRLSALMSVPAYEPDGAGRESPWHVLHAAAVVDAPRPQAEPVSTASRWITDEQQVWHDADPDFPDTDLRVMATAYRGAPVLYAVLESTTGEDALSKEARQKVVDTSYLVVSLAVSVVALILAVRNLRNGSGDRLAAQRLAAFVFALMLIGRFLALPVDSDLSTLGLLIRAALLLSSGQAVMVWLFYIALEPVVRRFWPQILITWTRLVRWRWDDPLVGQHLLVGVVVGVGWSLIGPLDTLLADALSLSVRPPIVSNRVLDSLIGFRFALTGSLDLLWDALRRGLIFTLLVVLMRAVLRRPIVAAVLTGLLMAPIYVPMGSHPLTAWLLIGVVGIGAAVWLMVRFGLLAFVTALFVTGTLHAVPISINPGVWYSDLTLYGVLIVLAVTAFAYLIAIGRPRRA